MASNRTLAHEAIRLATLVENAGITGPNADLLLGLLSKLSAHPTAKRTTTTAPEAKTTTEATPAPAKKRTRPPRAVPPGTWNPDRGRMLALQGREFDAPTIAKAVCAVFTAEASGFKTTDASIADAVSEAFPENHYAEYRVGNDRKKWANNLFAFQGKGVFAV